jgi:Protein of unknown function (DUF4245)
VSTTTGPQSPPPVPDAGAPGGPDPAPPPRGRGTRGTVTDMVRTMLVILAVVTVIYFLVPRPNQIVQPAADVGGAAAAAVSELGFAPLVPQGLPADWVPTEAAVRDAADGIKEFHIGYRVGTDVKDNAYAGVEQATRSTARWLEINDAGGTKVGDVTIDGVTWEQRYKPERAYTSLLLQRPNQVILVTSKNGGLAQAEVLARALHVPAS